MKCSLINYCTILAKFINIKNNMGCCTSMMKKSNPKENSPGPSNLRQTGESATKVTNNNADETALEESKILFFND